MLAAHENPDGDALGSLVAMQGLLSALGKDSPMFIAAGRPAATATSTASSRSTG